VYNSSYNPDVLSCIANLSSDEVFTPPHLANQILDLLPEELWSDKKASFLDPGCKSGVFLREIAKRLDKGLEKQIPDRQERLNHIFKHQLFGLAITELTALMSRRSLYCSKNANGKYSICETFDTPDGNIKFGRVEHVWEDGGCIYCGANEENYDRGAELETHAYTLIHTENPEDIFNMKFDVIIGNPPYQLSDGGHGASAIPIYQHFVLQAKKLKPRYLSMIIPARWYVGGRALDSFRNEMLNDSRIRVLHDFPDATDCFPGVEIKGGVCYFLWDRDNQGLCEIYEHNGEQVYMDTRALLEDNMETFIRSSKAVHILKKIKCKNEPSLSEHLNAGRYFGFHTKVDWIDNEYGTLQTADGQSSYPIKVKQSEKFPVKVYIAHGECWISKKNVARHKADVEKYKIIIPEAGNPGSTILGKPRISEPGSCSSNTYIVMVLQDNSIETAKNVISYLSTKFVRFLVALRTTTQHMAPIAYSFVPIQDFTKPWTDEKLYKRYGLTHLEIAFIESMIRPMEKSDE